MTSMDKAIKATARFQGTDMTEMWVQAAFVELVEQRQPYEPFIGASPSEWAQQGKPTSLIYLTSGNAVAVFGDAAEIAVSLWGANHG